MERYHRSATARSGFTLIEIMIVILIISVLLLIAVPSWIGARERSRGKSCVAQLREIRYAKESWAMENKKAGGETPVWSDLLVYLKTTANPQCPTGGTYTIGTVDEMPTCSIGGVHVLK